MTERSANQREVHTLTGKRVSVSDPMNQYEGKFAKVAFVSFNGDYAAVDFEGETFSRSVPTSWLKEVPPEEPSRSVPESVARADAREESRTGFGSDLKPIIEEMKSQTGPVKPIADWHEKLGFNTAEGEE
jgi:hypothetical protein